MKSFLKLTHLYVLLAVLGISVWSIGCGDTAATETPEANLGDGSDEAGTTIGGSTAFPPAEGEQDDAGKSQEDAAKKPAEAKKEDE